MERSTAADRCKFLDCARGSAGEVRTQTVVGMKVGFIRAETGDGWVRETKDISAMLQGLIRSLRQQT